MTDSVEIRRPAKKDELLLIVNNAPLVPTAKPRQQRLSDRSREELIKLVQRLFLSPESESPQVVVFSAVEQGSGCSWICARVVEILADGTESSVCLIDANFRSPYPYREFFGENPARLSEDEWTFAPIRRSDEAISSNLWLLSYRPTPADCPTAASLERFQLRIANLRKDFGYVLIDAPPLNGYADAALFGRMADGLVVVLEANNTRRETTRKAQHLLDQAGVPVLGAVLNKRVFPIPEPLYRRL